MYSPPNLQLQANGNIVPYRVVKIDTTADNSVLQSAANTSPNIGLAQGGTRRAPGTGDDDGNAAIAGENIMVWGAGCVGLGEASGAITTGDRLTADSNGRLLTTTTTADQCVGFALQKASALGDIIEVMVSPFTL